MNTNRIDKAESVRRNWSKHDQRRAFKGRLIDLGLRYPPCQGFRTDLVFYACSQVTQLLLRSVQHECWSGPVYVPIHAHRELHTGNAQPKPHLYQIQQRFKTCWRHPDNRLNSTGRILWPRLSKDSGVELRKQSAIEFVGWIQ